MAEFEPPSFSLGLDFDSDSEPQTTHREDPSFSKQARQSSSYPTFRLVENDDDFEIPDAPRTLKRLRRGPASESSAAQKESVEMCGGGDDDEIEEFSSQEDRRREKEHLSMSYQFRCNASKFPLHEHGSLTKQSASQRHVTTRKEVSSTPVSANLEMSGNKLVFPKLTVSPLRRLQLLDSDSDDSSVNEDANREAKEVDLSTKEKQYGHGHPTTSEQKRMKASVSVSQTEDLWKDFYTEKRIHVPTPALDEFCEEYFRSVEEKKRDFIARHDDKCTSSNTCSNQTFNFINNDEHQLGDPIPPAHRYFSHNDLRIQKLVSNRLSHFFPLGAIHNSANNHSISSVIDYRSQFSHGEGSQHQASGTFHAETSSRRGRTKLKKSTAEAVSHGSESWVTPSVIPKDAGKRRVHAVGQSGGHWYTGPDSKRVYVSKNGQELTGRFAYMHYRKERGAGFKNSKKKTAAKNTCQKKKHAAAKKK